jgi:hypothetical protein
MKNEVMEFKDEIYLHVNAYKRDKIKLIRESAICVNNILFM